jgi:hypothetical protein
VKTALQHRITVIGAASVSIGLVVATLAAPAQAVPKDRFKVTGAPALPTFKHAALTLDSHYTEHVVGTARIVTDPNSNAAYQLEYLTRKRGAKHWTHHLAAGGHSINYSQLVITPSTNGKRIDVVASDCANDLVTTKVSPRATRLPKPVPAYSGNPFPNCHGDGGYLSTGAAALPHGKLAVLITDDAEYSAPMVSTGKAGRSLADPVALPNPDALHLEARAISRDPKTGELTVVAGGALAEGGNVYAWTATSGGAWSNPTLIAGTAAVGYQTAALTSYGGVITVALYGGSGAPALSIVKRSSSGDWSNPSILPHTTSKDRSFSLVADPHNGHLHAVFTRAANNLDKDGIKVEIRTHGHWSKPKFLTHSVFDDARNVLAGRHHTTVVGYQRI